MGRLRLPGGRLQVLLDGVLLVWMAGWLITGVIVASEVRGLAGLSDAAASTGRAVVSVGDAVKALPLVGAEVREPADAVREAGAEAVSSAESAKASTRSVAVLLGVLIAAIPSLPVLLLYVPLRIATARERQALRRAVAGGPAPGVDEVLAMRAVARLPYRTLIEVSEDPARDLAEGRHRALAEAELRWFGVAPPQSPAG